MSELRMATTRSPQRDEDGVLIGDAGCGAIADLCEVGGTDQAGDTDSDADTNTDADTDTDADTNTNADTDTDTGDDDDDDDDPSGACSGHGGDESAYACPLEHLRTQLDAVRRSVMRNGYIRAPGRHLKAYVRVTRRYRRDLGFVATIDVANVVVHEARRNSGHFQAFLTDVERIAAEWGRRVFVECVLSDALHHVLRKRGYGPDESDQMSYWNTR